MDCPVMLWSLWLLRQDAFHHGCFGVQWIQALHLTGNSEGQPDQHRKVRLAGDSPVLPTLSEGVEIEHSDIDAESAMLKGDYLWQVVEIVIGGVPTVLEVCFKCFFMSLSRILFQGSISTDLFHPMRHQVDLRKVEVSILPLGNIHLVAHIIPPGVHIALLLGWHSTFSIWFPIYLSFFTSSVLRALTLAFAILLASPSKNTSLKVWKRRKPSSMSLNVASSW